MMNARVATRSSGLLAAGHRGPAPLAVPANVPLHRTALLRSRYGDGLDASRGGVRLRRSLAFADESSTAADAVATASTAAASAPAPDDPVVGAMFTLAVVALSVLTLGVAYLSISSFLDQRQEEEDRKKAGFGPSKAAREASGMSSRSSNGSDFDTSAFQPGSSSSSKGSKRKAPKKKSDKGFGK
jgi:hypothetical protein